MWAHINTCSWTELREISKIEVPVFFFLSLEALKMKRLEACVYKGKGDGGEEKN